jgi:anti-anti-sigma regulatory factor
MITVSENTIIIDSERASLEDKVHFENAVSSIVHNGVKEVRIDLGATIYLPSELMGFMMWKKKELQELKIKFTIVRISENLKKIFDNAMLTEFFEISSKTTEVI